MSRQATGVVNASGAASTAATVAARLVQSWLARMNIPLRQAWLAGVAFAAATAVLSVVTSLLLLAAAESIPRAPAFLGLAMALLHFLSILTAVTVTASTAQDSTVMAWWRSMPISDRVLGLGWSVPAWALTFAQLAVFVPAFITLFGESVNAVQITFLTLCAVCVGTIAGRGAFVAARAVLQRVSSNLSAYAQGLATLGWLLCLGAAPEAVRLALESDAGTHLSLASFLGYPSLVLAAVRGSVPDMLMLIAWLALAAVVEVMLWPRIAVVRHDSSKVLRVGPAYTAGGRFPLLRLELTRLVRRRRVQSAIVTALVVQAGLFVLFHSLEPAARPSFLDNAVLVNSILIAYAPLLARGMSSRSTPYAKVLACKPAGWALAVTAAGLIVGVCTSAPALVLWSIGMGDAGVLMAGLGLAMFTAAVGAVAGFLLMPNEETGLGETLGMLAVAGSLFIVAKALTSVGLDSMSSAGPVMGLLALPIMSIPILIEATRWDRFNYSSELKAVTSGKDQNGKPQ